MNKFPCKSCIKNTKGGCCNTLPVFSQSELARVMFKHQELLNELKLTPNTYNGDNSIFVLTPPLSEEEKKKGISLTDYICPFLDMEKGCLIYEDRPFICSGFGEVYGKCPFEGQEEVSEKEIIFGTKIGLSEIAMFRSHFTKDKPIKELDVKATLKITTKKEFRHLLFAFNELVEVLRNSDYFKKEYKYTFVQSQNKNFKPTQLILLKEEYPFSALQKPFNFLLRKLAVSDYSVLEILEKKINNIIKSMPKLLCPSTPEWKVLFSVLYLEYFKDNFKGKSAEYKSLINADDLYALKKEIFKRLGFDSYLEAVRDDKVVDMAQQVERIYKQINKLK